MTRTMSAAIAGLMLLQTSTALAQSSSPEAKVAGRYLERPEDGVTEVEALTVRVGKPAWWTVSSRQVRVHILGVPSAVPEDFVWRSGDLEAFLASSPFLLLPPAAGHDDDAGVASLALPNAGPLPGDLASRLAAAAQQLGQPVDRYASQHPVIAAYLLVGDFREKAGLRPDGVLQDIVRRVENDRRLNARVKVFHQGARTPPVPPGAFNNADPEAIRACLVSAIEEVEAGPQAAREAADAWRSGNVREALDAPRSLDLCAFTSPELAWRRLSAISDTTVSIAILLHYVNGDCRAMRAISPTLLPAPELMARPRSDYVFVVNLRSLVAEDGVLDQLARHGFTIHNPGTYTPSSRRPRNVFNPPDPTCPPQMMSGSTR